MNDYYIWLAERGKFTYFISKEGENMYSEKILKSL